MLDLKANPIATVRGDQPSGPVLETLEDGRKRTTGDLGPNQIEWLARKVYQFGPAKEQADRAKAQADAVAEQITSKAS